MFFKKAYLTKPPERKDIAATITIKAPEIDPNEQSCSKVYGGELFEPETESESEPESEIEEQKEETEDLHYYMLDFEDGTQQETKTAKQLQNKQIEKLQQELETAEHALKNEMADELIPLDQIRLQLK